MLERYEHKINDATEERNIENIIILDSLIIEDNFAY